MAVQVNSVGAGVEISWDPSGATPPTEERPPGFPTHPIFLPGTPEHPIVLPPTEPGVPTHPIYLPPYVDIGFPGDQPYPDNTLPDVEGGVDPGYGVDEDEGVLRPEHPIVIPPPSYNPPEGAFPGDPGYSPPPGGAVVTPQHDTTLGVQVFGQGQEGDWSNTAVMPNDGLALLRYPTGFSGPSYIEVRALDGSLVDSGTIQVG